MEDKEVPMIVPNGMGILEMDLMDQMELKMENQLISNMVDLEFDPEGIRRLEQVLVIFRNGREQLEVS